MKKITSIILLTSLTLCINANETNDNTESVYQLPDLTVTATLWDSELYNTTQSVSLVDSESIEITGSQHFQDLIETIPNLTFTGGTSRPRYFQIRGIGENSQFEGETPDATVRFLIDDFDFTGLGGVTALHNIKQIEVLRGPQAGAFGANAAAGSIQILTQEPTSEHIGTLKLTLGNDSLNSSAFTQSGPLNNGATDSMNYGITISKSQSDGFVTNNNLNRKDTNQKDETFALLKFNYDANDSLSIKPAIVYTNFNNGYDEWSLQNTPFTTYSDQPGRDEQRSVGASLRIESTKPNALSMTSITSHLNTNSLYSYDSDWGALQDDYVEPILPEESGYSGFIEIDRERKNFSQEFRLDSAEKNTVHSFIHRWTAGAYFSQLDEYTDMNYQDNFEFENQQARVASDYNSETIALFGKIGSQLNPKTHLDIGIRYEIHDIQFNSNTIDNAVYEELDDEFIPTGELIHALEDGSNVENKSYLNGFKIDLSNQLNPRDTLYASITKGYKSGGVNSSSFTDSGQSLTYETENLMNYEVGLSHRSIDNRFRSKINAFYLTRENAQVRDSDGTAGFFRYFTTNEGDAEHYGLEYQSAWSFKKDFSLHSELGLLKAKLKSSNRDLANAPHYSYGFKLLYTPQNGYFGSLSINGSDDYFEENSDPTKRDAFETVNASLGYQNDKMNLTFWVNNLFDQAYSKRVFYFDNYNPSQAGETDYSIQNNPRTFGISLSYKW